MDPNQFLRTVRDSACRLPVETFVKRYEGLFVFYYLPAALDGDFDFVTSVGDSPFSGSSADLAAEAEKLIDTKGLGQIAKSDRNPWGSRITVGRASNNDIIIRHPSVSKVHAFFETARRRPGDDELRFHLVDPGSSNGTRVNGELLSRDQGRDVRAGTRLFFGEVEAEVFDAAGLHAQIRAILPTAELLRSMR